MKTRKPGDLFNAFQAKKKKASSVIPPVNFGKKNQAAYAKKFAIVPQTSTQVRTKKKLKASKLDTEMAFKKKRKASKKKAAMACA